MTFAGGEGTGDDDRGTTPTVDPATVDLSVHDGDAEKMGYDAGDGTVVIERKLDRGREEMMGAEPRRRRGKEEKKEGHDDCDGDGSTIDARASSSSTSSPSSKSQQSQSSLPPPPLTFVDDVNLDPKIRLQHYYHTLTPRVTLSTKRDFVDDNDYREVVSASAPVSGFDEASKKSSTIVKEPEKFWRSRFVCPVTKLAYHSFDNLGGTTAGGPDSSSPSTAAAVAAGEFWYHPTKRAAQKSAALCAASSIIVFADPLRNRDEDHGEGPPGSLDGMGDVDVDEGTDDRRPAGTAASVSSATSSSSSLLATRATMAPPRPSGGRGIHRNLAGRLFDLDVGIYSPSDIVSISVSHVLVPPPPPPPREDGTRVPIDEVATQPPSREVPTLLRCSMTVKLPDHLAANAVDGEHPEHVDDEGRPTGADGDPCGADDDCDGGGGGGASQSSTLTVLGEPCHTRYRAVRSAIRLLEVEVGRRRGRRPGRYPPPQARHPGGGEVEVDREGGGEEERERLTKRAQFLKRMKLSGPVRVDYLFPLSECFVSPFSFGTFPPPPSHSKMPTPTQMPTPTPSRPSPSDSPAKGGGGSIDEYVYLYELTLTTKTTNDDGGGGSLPLAEAMGFDRHHTTRMGVVFPRDIESPKPAPSLTTSGTEPRHVARVDLEGRDDLIRGLEASLTYVRRVPSRDFFLLDQAADKDSREEDTYTSTKERRRRWTTTSRWEMVIAFNQNVLNWRQYGFFKAGYQKWGQGKRRKRKKKRCVDGDSGGDDGKGSHGRDHRRPHDPLSRTYLFVPLVRQCGVLGGGDRKRRRSTRGGDWRERHDDGGISRSYGGGHEVDKNDDVDVDWDLLDRAYRHRLTPFMQASTNGFLSKRSRPPVPWTDQVRTLRLARRVCGTLAILALSVPFLRRSLRGDVNVHTMEGWTDEVIDLADVAALGFTLIPGLVVGLMRLLWSRPRRPPVGLLRNRFLTTHEGKLCVYDAGDEEENDEDGPSSEQPSSLLRVHWLRCHADFDLSKKRRRPADKDFGIVPTDSLSVLPMPRDVPYAFQHAARFMEPLERAVELSHLEGRIRHLCRMANIRLMGCSGGGTTTDEEGMGVDDEPRPLLTHPRVGGRRNRPRKPSTMTVVPPSLRSLVTDAATLFPRITYERLEFLGDTVLGHFVAINLFSRNSALKWDVDDVQERKDHACKNGTICEAALRVGLNRVIVSARRPWRSAYDARGANDGVDSKRSGGGTTLLPHGGGGTMMRHFTGNVSDKNIADVTEALLAAAYLGGSVDAQEEMMNVDTPRHSLARTGSYVIGLLDELELAFEPPTATAARRSERGKEGEDVDDGEHHSGHRGRSWFVAPGACIDRGYPLDFDDDWRRRIDDVGSIIENDHKVGTRLCTCLESFLRLLDRVASSNSSRPSTMATMMDAVFNDRDKVLLMASLFDDSLGCEDDDEDSEFSGSCSSSNDGSCTSDAGSSLINAEDGLVRVALLRDSMFAVGNASILLCLTEEIYHRFPDATPGDMHLLRTVILGDDPLVYVMMKNGLQECLYDAGAESVSKFKREVMIADALGIDSWRENGGWVLDGGVHEFRRRYVDFVNVDGPPGHDDTTGNDEGHATTTTTTVLPRYVGLVGGRLRGHGNKVDPKITRDLVFSVKVIVGALVLSVGLDITRDMFLLPMFTELLLLSPDELRDVYGHLSTISRTYQRG